MANKKLKQTVTVIRYLDDEGDYVYLCNAWKTYDDSDYTWRCTCAYTLEEAMDLSDRSDTERLEMFMGFQEYYDDVNAEIVRVVTTVETEDLTDVDEGDYREMRQRIALKKLNENDIKALGIVNIATYIKTKYHNS